MDQKLNTEPYNPLRPCLIVTFNCCKSLGFTNCYTSLRNLLEQYGLVDHLNIQDLSNTVCKQTEKHIP